MSKVMDLRTGKEFSYPHISPERAVVNAFEQYENKNWNTWDYNYSKYKLSYGTYTVACGDYCAIRIYGKFHLRNDVDWILPIMRSFDTVENKPFFTATSTVRREYNFTDDQLAVAFCLWGDYYPMIDVTREMFENLRDYMTRK